MKKRILVASCLAICIMAFAQKAPRQYIVVDDNIKEEVTQAAAAKYAKGDDMKEAAFRTLIGDAFTAYFGHKKTRAEVVSRDSVNSLNRQLATARETITNLRNQLSQANAKAQPDAKDREWKNKCDSVKQSMDGVLAERSRECDSLQRLLAETQGRLSELNTRQAALEQNASVFKNIEKRLSDLQAELNKAYEKCTTGSLSGINDCAEMESAVKSYSDFMKMLDQAVPAEQKEQIALIQSSCKAAEYYQKASSLLDGKYDKAAVDKMVKEYSAVEPYLKNMNSQQAAELARVHDLLKWEDNVILNFRETILKELLDMRCIPDPTAYNIAMDTTLTNWGIYNGDDPNCKEGYYDNGYRYINKQLEKLYSGLENYSKNKFEDPKTFEKFLKGIGDSLGDKTGS